MTAEGGQKYLAQLGCAVDSVDSVALAEALSARAPLAGHTLEVMLQVNIDQEPQKAGVSLAEAPALAAQVAELEGLRLMGLMAIPRASDDAERTRPAFRRMRELAERLGLSELSMGMSADYEVAIEEGATMVRVGTAVFGARP